MLRNIKLNFVFLHFDLYCRWKKAWIATVCRLARLFVIIIEFNYDINNMLSIIIYVLINIFSERLISCFTHREIFSESCELKPNFNEQYSKKYFSLSTTEERSPRSFGVCRVSRRQLWRCQWDRDVRWLVPHQRAWGGPGKKIGLKKSGKNFQSGAVMASMIRFLIWNLRIIMFTVQLSVVLLLVIFLQGEFECLPFLLKGCWLFFYNENLSVYHLFL